MLEIIKKLLRLVVWGLGGAWLLNAGPPYISFNVTFFSFFFLQNLTFFLPQASKTKGTRVSETFGESNGSTSVSA